MKELNDLLLESCSVMYDISQKKCGKDFVDNENGCSWYHSVWQYLRALNCVSAPQWHENFYYWAFSDLLEGKKSVRILISGTADYSFLHLILSFLVEKKIFAHIAIIDKCPTPLKICNWYMENINEIFPISDYSWIQTYITIENIEKDLLYYNASDDKKYDIICSDSFLTRFSKDDVFGVLKKWKDLLTSKGRVVTTVRIHNDKKEVNLLDYTKGINMFQKKVEERFNNLPNGKRLLKNGQSISKSELLFMTYNYIIRMKSCSLGDKKDIEAMFLLCGFKIDTQLSSISPVEGEISETTYYQIVAEV